jgi:hypothetical protein
MGVLGRGGGALGKGPGLKPSLLVVVYRGLKPAATPGGKRLGLFNRLEADQGWGETLCLTKARWSECWVAMSWLLRSKRGRWCR